MLPLLGLAVFWLWPLSLALPAYVVILLLSAWIYYYAIAAMRREVITGREALLHSRGEVVSIDASGAHVRVRSERWEATSAEALSVGDAVEVLGIDGVTLRVRRVSQSRIGDPMRTFEGGSPKSVDVPGDSPATLSGG